MAINAAKYWANRNASIVANACADCRNIYGVRIFKIE